jgi:hypothetical protein
MFFMNLTFCSLALVLLTLVAVEAECIASHGHLLADAEIALKQPPVRAAQMPAAERNGLRVTP